MEIDFQWQTVRSGSDCWKGDHVRIYNTEKDLRLTNTHSAVVRIDRGLKAEIYEKQGFQGGMQRIFADQEISCIKSIGSVKLMPKSREDEPLAAVYIKNPHSERTQVTYLPRGVYDTLSVCGFVESDPGSPLRLEKFHDLVQLVETGEDPDVILRFKKGSVLNCYRGLLYTNVDLSSACDIEVDPQTTLVVGQGNEQIRILQSVNGFKPLGALVTLSTHRQLPIESLAMRALDLSVAGMQQLMLILFIVCVVALIAIVKARRSLQTPESGDIKTSK